MTQSNIETARATVLEAVLGERERQDILWGDQLGHSDAWWTVISAEENGEVARAVYEQDVPHTYIEIIQACAVYFAWAEAILRRSK
tara:strand:+ start:1439 stop:1696 length:258 start_codon:yes stop_codon:yes gene_type:complete